MEGFGTIIGIAANKFGIYCDKTTQDYTYYNRKSTISVSSCCRPIPRIALIILPYMNFKACDEPIDDTNKKMALIFYVENPTV
jgi:hypothetical protein